MVVRVHHTAGKTNLSKLGTSASKLALCACVLSYDQLRRLLKGTDSADVCKELKLPVGRNEATNCRTIAKYFGN